MSAENRDGDDPLQSLIAEIFEAENRCETVNREELVEQHPDHAESLREFIANHDRMKSAAGSFLEDSTILPDSINEDPTIAPTEPASPDKHSGDRRQGPLFRRLRVA